MNPLLFAVMIDVAQGTRFYNGRHETVWSETTHTAGTAEECKRAVSHLIGKGWNGSFKNVRIRPYASRFTGQV